MALSLPGQPGWFFHEGWSWSRGYPFREYSYMRNYTYGDALNDQGADFSKFAGNYVRTLEWDGQRWIKQFEQGIQNIPRGLTDATLPTPNEVPGAQAPPSQATPSAWAGVGRVLLAAAGVVVLVWGASRRADVTRERDRKRLG